MEIKLDTLFSSECGREIYASAERVIAEYGMQKSIFRGTLVGLSGGADSVMLLLFLVEYRRRTGDFPILAVHINHLIRGDEADRDEKFSRELCDALGVEFLSRRIDVPTLAKVRGVGIEECARDVRYSEFGKIIRGRNDISTIAIAHNADDNLETVILNMMRGGGSRGLAGIPPTRDNIVRPLILCNKEKIVTALGLAGVTFVTDSTNLTSDYKRNYIRHEILPRLRTLTDSPEMMAARSSANLRSDDEFITSVAREFLAANKTVTATDLRTLHKSVLVRVISMMAEEYGSSLSSLNFEQIEKNLSKDDFTLSLPGGVELVAEHGVCRFRRKNETSPYEYNYSVRVGENVFREFDAVLHISDKKCDKFSLNVYKISIQADLSSAIINGSLYLRPKRDGDTVFYGGMTHKLKKLFSDRKIPPSLRESIPILCDGSGVLWVPGFGVRDDGESASNGQRLYATLSVGLTGELSDTRFRIGSEFRTTKK